MIFFPLDLHKFKKKKNNLHWRVWLYFLLLYNAGEDWVSWVCPCYGTASLVWLPLPIKQCQCLQPSSKAMLQKPWCKMSGSNPGLLSIVFWPHPLFAKGAPPCATPGVGIVTQDHRETHTSPAGFLTLGGGSRPVQLFPAHPSPRCHLGCSICEEVCREFTSFLPVSCCTSWATSVCPKRNSGLSV